MKKLIAGLVTVVMTFSMCGAAFAAETATEKAEKQPIPQEIIDKKTSLKSIAEENQAIRDQLESVNNAIKELASVIKDKEKTKLKDEIAEKKSLQEKSKNDATTLKASLQNLNTQLKDAVKEKNTTKTEDIKGQITDVKAQLETLKTDSKTAFENFKKDLEAAKAKHESLKAIKGQLESYKQTVKSTHEHLKSQHTTMQGYWDTLSSAMKNKDYTTASSTLDKMIQLKKDIQANLNTLLTVKNEIKDLLTSLK